MIIDYGENELSIIVHIERKMFMDKAQKAYDELKKGIQNYIKISLDNVPMDKTFTALIKSYGEEEGTYNIILNNTEYKNVPSLGGTCIINETVRVMIPQNNYTNMFILKSASEGGGGEGDMLKAVYDKNDNGIVDDSEMLGGNLPSYYQAVESQELTTEDKTVVGAVNEINDKLNQHLQTIAYTDPFTLPSTSKTYTYKNSLIKADSVLDIYFSEETQEYLKGIDITFTQKDGSLTFNLSKVPNHTLVINTMRISKVIGSGEEQTSCEIGIIKEIETTTFDYRVSGAIEPKEGE